MQEHHIGQSGTRIARIKSQERFQFRSGFWHTVAVEEPIRAVQVWIRAEFSYLPLKPIFFTADVELIVVTVHVREIRTFRVSCPKHQITQ